MYKRQTQLAILEYLTTGVTSVFDMYLSPKDIARACVDMGMRCVLVSGLNKFGPALEVMEDVYKRQIGDPSGRSDMRTMMTKETIDHNCECFRKQMSKFIDFSEGKAILANNADWLLDLNYVELLREVGACFSVNNMLRAECYKQRMEKGLSFLEFNYMIMQSYDFLMLYKKYGCNMQFGGDDQWSNMLGGTELIRRKLGKDAYAMTITLLLNSEGKKMGKTQKLSLIHISALCAGLFIIFCP